MLNLDFFPLHINITNDNPKSEMLAENTEWQQRKPNSASGPCSPNFALAPGFFVLALKVCSTAVFFLLIFNLSPPTY